MDTMVKEALDAPTQRKLQLCRKILTDMKSVLVAFSGGLDSSVLLALAVDVLGAENVVAGMSVSTLFPQRGLSAGRQLARKLGVEMVELPTPQLVDASFSASPMDGCYYSKSQTMSHLKELARQRGLDAVISGGNVDDMLNHPGSRAEEHLSIRRPFQEAGLDHKNVLAIAEMLNLCIKCYEPSGPLPSAHPVTPKPTGRVEHAQAILAKLGIVRSRLIDHGEMARIQVDAADMIRAVEKAKDLAQALKKLGFRYVALDLEAMK